MTSGPLVSTVICGYNQGRYLAQAIESVLDQTYPNVEAIVIDNGSTDESHQVARRYADRPNVRLLLFDQGANITTRSNQGIESSSGDFISFLYADDWYLPQKFEQQMNAFASLPPDYGVVYAPGYRYNIETGTQWVERTPRWSGWVLESMLRDYHRAWLNMDAPLARRECYLRYPFHEDLFQEGEGIFMRIALRYRFHPLSEPLVVMREHRGNLGKAYELQTRMNLVVLQRLQREPEFSETLVPLLGRVRAAKLRNLGWQMIRLADDPVKARTYLMESLMWHRTGVLHPRFFVGAAMSLLPRPAVRSLNRVVSRVRRHRENRDVVTKLGPGSDISSVPTV